MEKEKTIIAVEEKAAVAELEQNDLDQVVGAGRSVQGSAPGSGTAY